MLGENYDMLAESLKVIIEEMKNLKEIFVDSENYNFEYFLGGD